MLGGSIMQPNPQASQSTARLSTNQPAPLFSSLGAAPAQSSFSSSQQQQQVVPAVRIDLSNIKPTTRFFELHEDLQKQISLVDDFVQTQISLFAQCAAFMPEHGALLSTIPADVEYVSKKHETLTHALGRDAQEISGAKDVTAGDIADARRAFAAVENLKLPAQFRYSAYAAPDASGAGGDDGTSDFAASSLLPYFEAKTKDSEHQLARVTSLISEIEAHVRTVEGNATEQTHRLLRRQAAAAGRANGVGVNGSGDDLSKERVLELAAAMQMFEDAVLRVASKVGEVREGVIECTVGGASKGVNGGYRRR
jgi:nucleoporin p58/p45